MVPLLRVVAKKGLANLNRDSQVCLNHLDYSKVLISNLMNLYLNWLSVLMCSVCLPLLNYSYVVPTLKCSVKSYYIKVCYIISLMLKVLYSTILHLPQNYVWANVSSIS